MKKELSEPESEPEASGNKITGIWHEPEPEGYSVDAGPLAADDEPDLKRQAPATDETVADIEETVQDSIEYISEDVSFGEDLSSGDELPTGGEDVSLYGDILEADTVADSGNYEDYPLLYEVENEIIKARDRDELFEVVLFSIMGQIGCTSSSLLVQEKHGGDRWILAVSRGVKIDTEGLFFQIDRGILSQLNSKKNIIDVDDYRNDSALRDDYLTFLSVDARYIAPVLYGGEMIGAVLMGEKVSVEDYTDEEKEFITIVCETAGIALYSILEREKLYSEISDLKRNISEMKHVDHIQETIVHDGSLDNMESTIREEFEKQGITSYAVFGKNRKENSFSPFVTESEDFISLIESGSTIDEKTLFVRHLSRSEAPVVIDNFRTADIVKDVFTENQINRMSMFRCYPFVMGDRNIGFIIIFRVREGLDLNDVDIKVKKISRFIFAYLNLLLEIDSRYNRYIDNIETIYQRIEREIENAKQLDIPLSLVLFSIKNFKRYYNTYGYDTARAILRDMEKVIRSRLSDSDFSVRYGRNRFLLVLPGKDKKYAVPLATAIRNRIVETSGEQDLQLLVTFLATQYPDDGDDVFSLMDSLE